MQRIHVTIRALNREDSVLYFPPEAFGPFRVLHQIGAGTLGPVFRAYEPGRDRLVAVKVFRLDLTPEQSAALVDELRALVGADLDHPNIAAPIAAGLDYGAAYLAQEYAVGDTLDIVLRDRGPMPIHDVVALVSPLAAAIDHAAERGVNHGLLHLRDILLGADTVRITGLGIAGALTKVGARLPTRPQYSSPDVASDVYSLAAIAFEAATGKRVSTDNLQDLEAAYGAALREAFSFPLATNPQMRPARATAFAEALQRAVGITPPAAAKPAPIAPVAPTAPIAPAVPVAPIAPVDPLDREIDLAPPKNLELVRDAPVDSTPPLRMLDDVDVDAEPRARRWRIAAAFVGFAIAVALVAGYFLREPVATPVDENERGVDSTVVDLPASASPSPNATADKPAPVAPTAPVAPRTAPAAPTAPRPSPSRPASGAIQRAQTGSMLIRSTPADADVLVNGTSRGKTPLALRDLALGSYTIRVARDGYEEEERTLQLTARRPTASATITLRSQKTGPGGLNVQSRPPGARVFVNDRLAGSTPLAIASLPVGSATVRIELDGYRPWTTTVRIVAGEQARVGASLEER